MVQDWKQARNQPIKLPVKAVTTIALPVNTYANGTSGAGATLTANVNGALPAIDGVVLVTDDRLLVKNEVAPANNGIYQVTVVGNAGTKYILTRTDDCNTNVRIFAGISVLSTADGLVNGRLTYQLTTVGAITVGTTALAWASTISSTPTLNPNLRIQASNYVIPVNYSLIIHQEYEIGDGFELEISDGANLELT